MKAAWLALLMVTPALATEQEEFDKIMNIPPMFTMNVCNEVVNDVDKFQECIYPYARVLDCRFRVKKLIMTDENQKKFTKDELTHKFLESYHLCTNGGDIYDQEK